MSVFFYQPGIPEGKNFLEDEEANHCARVLRKRPGDQIHIMDGRGRHYKAELTSSTSRRCDFVVTESRYFEPDPYMIQLAIAPTKSADRIEWMAEKCVELGLHRLTLLNCEHGERKRFRTDRLMKKMISAMKQSQQAYAPVLDSEMMNLETLISQSTENLEVMMAYIDPSAETPLLRDLPLTRDCCLLIGPEGDFSENEITLARSKGVKMVSLGPHRLRTETAGMAAAYTQLMKLQ